MSQTAEQERTSFVAQLLEEVWPFPLPVGPLPDPTPSEGPDPYGNPEPEWLEIDWRRQLRQVELDDPAGARRLPGREGPTRVNYAEMGSGEPALLFVHGLSGSWQNWLENIPHFARSRRVVAPDLPGFGASRLPPWEISIRAYGRILHDLVAALGIGDCVVVGNSMGGFVAAEAAIAEPDRFERLVLASAAGITTARMRRQPAETLARMGAALAPLTLKRHERALRRPRVRHATFRNIFHAPHLLRTELLWEQWRHGVTAPGLVPAVQGLVGYDFLDRLEEVRVPTLIVWGRNDHIVPPQDAQGFAERLRDSRTVILDRTGHCPQLERPVRFNRLLEHFLQEQAPAGTR